MPDIQDYHFDDSLKDNPREKITRLITAIGVKQLTGFVLTLVLALGLPALLVATQQKQVIKQHAAESSTTNYEWTAWNTLNGVLTAPPSAAVFQNQLFSVVRGTQDTLYMRVSRNGQDYTPWQNLQIVTPFAPFSISYQNKLYVFYVATDKTLRYKVSLDGQSWGKEENLQGIATSSPSVTVVNDGLYVYVRGTENKLYLRKILGTTIENWVDLKLSLANTPTLVTYQNMVYLFTRESNNQAVYRTSSDGVRFSNPTSLGGILTSDLTATVHTPVGQAPILFVFGKGTTNTMYERHTTTGTAFSDWVDLDKSRSGGTVASSPSAVSFQNLLYLFAQGPDTTLYQRSIRPADTIGSSLTELGKLVILPKITGGSQYAPFVMKNPQNNNYLMYTCRATNDGSPYWDRVFRTEMQGDGKNGVIATDLAIQGTLNTEDDLSCSAGVVIDAKGIWHMYYVTANRSSGLTLYLHHATSTATGKVWQKQGRVTIQGMPQPFKEYVETPSPLLVNGKIILYLVGQEGNLFKTESSDGVTFSPLMSVKTPQRATHGHVKYSNGKYYYIYSRLPLGETYKALIPQNWTTSNAIFIAKSEDGITFSNEKLLFKAPGGNDWDGRYVLTPDLMVTDSEMQVYYAGDNTTFYYNPLEGTSIGMRWYPLATLTGM